MELKFLGRGSAFNTKEGNTSAYYKKNDMLLLIDCGESIFQKIVEKNLLEGVKDINILITHLHSDHVGSLSSLIMYCYYCKGIKPNVLLRDKKQIDIKGYLKSTGAEINKLWNKLSVVEFRNKYNIDIMSRESSHVKELYSVGYVIKNLNDNSSIYYTGDTNESDRKGIDYELVNCNKIYHDTCLADYEGNVHTSLRKLCELVPKEYRNKVWCMHLDCNELIEKAKIEGFNVVGINE